MGLHGKGVGVYSKMSGSGSPSFVLADQPDPEVTLVHPFKVSAYMDGGEGKVRVRAGTVNNIVPTIDGVALDDPNVGTVDLSAGDGTYRIYLAAEASSPPVFFPNTCAIVPATIDTADTDAEGFLKIASVVIEGGAIKSINQFVYASQVLVRAKPGTATALWSWSSR